MQEARDALDGGAELIDVKEPSRGPLGAADSEVIEAIIREIGNRVPVSVAMGELDKYLDLPIPSAAALLKWGLSETADTDTDRVWLKHYARKWNERFVVVAYADANVACSPGVEALATLACECNSPAFLIDTFTKDGRGLLDFIEPATLARIRFQLEDAGVPIALAGSLNEDAIRKLSPLRPDWFAVRGAVCDGGRNGTVSREKVRRLRDFIRECSESEDSPTGR